MTVRTARGQNPGVESQTTIAWHRPGRDQITVAVNGVLDARSRNLFRSVIARAIDQRPRRVVVEMNDEQLFDSDENYELIVSLEWQADDAGVALVSAIRAAS